MTTKTRETAEDIYTGTFTAAEETIYLTRNLVRSALDMWGLEAYASDACQIMSELASNAARLTESRAFRAWVSRIDVGIELCVWDDHPGRPVIQQPHPFDVSGRGLILVQAFASGGCGWFDQGAGKTVWARIAIDYGYMYAAARRAGCPIVGPLRHVQRPRTAART